MMQCTKYRFYCSSCQSKVSVLTFTHSGSRSDFALGDLELQRIRKTSESELNTVLYPVRPPISFTMFKRLGHYKYRPLNV